MGKGWGWASVVTFLRLGGRSGPLASPFSSPSALKSICGNDKVSFLLCLWEKPFLLWASVSASSR